ncbi:HEAT repeat protein [Dyadobacter jejuensis]|uniref:HEAT repeat protein n=1 Tax=Dyadobacter jejuensis TaxID=1082580 RepID=A0A316AS85_9BACT|nr:family 16 glycoside hydrolase [Dyadobacter jejuensis]PWJ60555.1 HEAT repeat protein [Dyadobacter jejuensis]
MKKQYQLIVLLCLFAVQSWAQTDAGRTLSTKVADILAQTPANDAAKLNKNNENIAELGVEGLVQMATMLVPADKGDNSKVKFALGGFTFAATKSGHEAWRKLAAAAYGQALPKVSDTYGKVFLIYQLQQVGQDESVALLKSYLSDKDLVGPASRALARIGTEQAGSALLEGFATAKGEGLLAITEALGEAKIVSAAPAIEKNATSSDETLRKISLFALSEIASPSSMATLQGAAKAVGFGYNESDATAVYLKYLARLSRNGSADIAEKAALTLIKAGTNAIPTATRSAALKVYADSKKDGATPILTTAIKSDDAQYRAAALKLGQKYTLSSGSTSWLKAMKKAKPEVQAEVIRMLGASASQDALPVVLKSMASKNTSLKMAAIWAAGKIGGESVVGQLIPLLKTGDAAEIATIQSTLQTMQGTDMVNQLASALPQLPASAQPAAIAVLAGRSANASLPTVSKLLTSTDADVKAAAYEALPSLTTASDLPQLYALANTAASASELNNVQQAIALAIKKTGSTADQSSKILTQMASAPKAAQANYLEVLAAIGGSQALEAVAKAYTNGDAATKKTAIDALSHWTDGSAAIELLRIGQNTNDSQELQAALAGYVSAIKKSTSTRANKVIMLREAMNIAKTKAQKTMILQEIGRTRTFNAMVFAGQYLDDAELQQAAAQAVIMTILANKEFYGTEVRSLLNKSLALLTGNESEYQKAQIRKHLAEMPEGEGFVSLFNGQDLTGWKGLVANPIKRNQMSADTLAYKQKIADQQAMKDWVAKNGELVFTGHGDNLCTIKEYGDFEMYVDWKIQKEGDAGIYLRGTPQVQIWDTSRVSVGAQVGSGGLYNNQKHPSKPSQVADNAIGEWNTFHITMVGDRVSVDLNGINVVNNVTLENYWDRSLPIFAKEQIELQAHGTEVAYRDIYIREIPRPEPYQLTAEEQKAGYKVLFDGTNMHEWIGNKTDYFIENGELVIDPTRGGSGNLYTKDEYSDFVYRFEFQLTPGANNGLGIRAPLTGDAAYVGTELQILDNDADIYKNLKEYQYHGSAYGIIPAKRGYLKPVGEWNYQEVYLKGSHVKVTLNGTVILDGDLAEASKNGTADHRDHPGLQRTSGHIGYLGHGNPLRFKNIRILDLAKASAEAPVESGKKGKKAKGKK